MMRRDRKIVSVHLAVSEHDIAGVLQFIGTLTPHKEEFALYDGTFLIIIIFSAGCKISEFSFCNVMLTKPRPPGCNHRYK